MLCGDEAETVEHILRNCSFAEQVWFESPLSFLHPVEPIRSFKQWAWTIVHRNEPSILGLFFIIY